MYLYDMGEGTLGDRNLDGRVRDSPRSVDPGSQQHTAIIDVRHCFSTKARSPTAASYTPSFQRLGGPHLITFLSNSTLSSPRSSFVLALLDGGLAIGLSLTRG